MLYLEPPSPPWWHTRSSRRCWTCRSSSDDPPPPASCTCPSWRSLQWCGIPRAPPCSNAQYRSRLLDCLFVELLRLKHVLRNLALSMKHTCNHSPCNLPYHILLESLGYSTPNLGHHLDEDLCSHTVHGCTCSSCQQGRAYSLG